MRQKEGQQEGISNHGNVAGHTVWYFMNIYIYVMLIHELFPHLFQCWWLQGWRPSTQWFHRCWWQWTGRYWYEKEKLFKNLPLKIHTKSTSALTGLPFQIKLCSSWYLSQCSYIVHYSTLKCKRLPTQIQDHILSVEARQEEAQSYQHRRAVEETKVWLQFPDKWHFD